MPVYTDLQAKIVADGGDGAGTHGPIGSFNDKGGKGLVIEYKTGKIDNAGNEIYEVHHIVPYLIGEAHDKDDKKVSVLLAWKYIGPLMPPPPERLGFRCYKVANIKDPLPTSPPPGSRPPLGPDRKKVKIKRQNCVEKW